MKKITMLIIPILMFTTTYLLASYPKIESKESMFNRIGVYDGATPERGAYNYKKSGIEVRPTSDNYVQSKKLKRRNNEPKTKRTN